MVTEALSKALGFTVAAATYGETALVLLANIGRIEARREEASELARGVEDEARLEAETELAKEEAAQRKAENEARRIARGLTAKSPSQMAKDAEREARRRKALAA